MVTDNSTLPDLDLAIKQAWASYRKYSLAGDDVAAERCLRFIDGKLEIRSRLTAAVPA